MAETKKPKEFSLDTKVVVTSIAGWNTGFARKGDGYGDIDIAPHGQIRLSRNEILSQVQNGNKLFTGTDGRGSHATLYIDDKETREEIGFEDGDAKQLIFSDDLAKEMFSANFTQFVKKFDEYIVTRAEKYAIYEAAKKFNLNDYDKRKYIELKTGYRN